MDHDISKQKTCKNISNLSTPELARAPIAAALADSGEGAGELELASAEMARGSTPAPVAGAGDPRAGFRFEIIERGGVGLVPGQPSVRKEPRYRQRTLPARLQTLRDNEEEIKRNRKRRLPAHPTPRGQFGGTAQYKPAFLEEIATLREPAAQEFRDLRRQTLNLSRGQCADLLRLCKGTIDGWEHGLSRIPFSAYLALHLLSDGHRSRFRVLFSDNSAPPAEAGPFPLEPQERRTSGRERANMLRERMHRFSSIYNAAWGVRDAAFGGNHDRKRGNIETFAEVLMKELWNCDDPEALIYAVADAIMANTRGGIPWEG